MKSCPKCNRTFPDEGQKFCTFDGGLLIAPQTFDPNMTIRATSADIAQPPSVSEKTMVSEKTTSRELPDPEATISLSSHAKTIATSSQANTIATSSQAPTVALPRNTGPTGPSTTADMSPPAPSPLQSAPSARGMTGSVAAPKKKSKLPWIIVGVLLFLILGCGALAGVFFVVIKPRLDGMSGRRTVAENPPPAVEETNKNAGPQATPVAETKPAAEVDSFVPPPDSVAFKNAKDNLDGKLADHYFDFSFYYPKSWQSDPKAGVPGATNFAKVERSLPPDFTQENFAVGWYTSEGTFAADLPSYPRRVEEFSKALSKVFPEYHKVSEGPTKINSMDAYEFRWAGVSKGTEKGDLQLWGRVVFLPTGVEGDKSGATLTMFATSLAPELLGVEDVGEKGEMPVILESFRVGKKK
jgi:hypothetical protein